MNTRPPSRSCAAATAACATCGDTREGVAGLFDRVEIEYEEDGERETITLMTTLREDAVNGIISKESPLGRAVMGRRVGDRALVKVNDEIQYYIRILSIAKGQDDDSLPISSF